MLADSVGLAMLVVLETLTPAERLAFVLHDMFGVPFEDIAPIVDRTPDATRQLASRARRRVRGGAPVPDPDLARQTRGGRRVPGCGPGRRLRAPCRRPGPGCGVPLRQRPDGARAGRCRTGGAAGGARRVPRFATACRVAIVNGAAGIVVEPPTGPVGIVGVTVVNGRIVRFDLITDPARWMRWRTG